MTILGLGERSKKGEPKDWMKWGTGTGGIVYWKHRRITNAEAYSVKS
jgi:hypothetical protein